MNCNLSEYEAYIQDIGDSELLGILGHINKISVPDRYDAVVREGKRRGLIGKGLDDMQLQAWEHARPTRKRNPRRNIKLTFILVSFICVLSAIPFGIGIWHGLKYGLLAGLIAFLLHGGIEWLWAAATWPKDEVYLRRREPLGVEMKENAKDNSPTQ